MKKLEEIQKIVNYSKRGWSDCKIAEEFNMSRNTVRKYRKRYWKAHEDLISVNPSMDYQTIEDILTSKPKIQHNKTRRPYKYTQEIDELLDKILDEDERDIIELGKKPSPKTQIHRKIREAGFDIGYTTISKKIDEKRLARSNIGPWKNTDLNTE